MERFALPVNAGKQTHFPPLDKNTTKQRSMFSLSLILCRSNLDVL